MLLSVVATEPRPGEVLPSHPRVPSTPPSAAARIDALLETARDRGIFNGSALVARADAVVYRGDFGNAWQRLAEALAPTSRDEAIAGYRRALELDPSHKTAREALDRLVALPER